MNDFKHPCATLPLELCLHPRSPRIPVPLSTNVTFLPPKGNHCADFYGNAALLRSHSETLLSSLNFFEPYMCTHINGIIQVVFSCLATLTRHYVWEIYPGN